METRLKLKTLLDEIGIIEEFQEINAGSEKRSREVIKEFTPVYFSYMLTDKTEIRKGIKEMLGHEKNNISVVLAENKILAQRMEKLLEEHKKVLSGELHERPGNNWYSEKR